MFHCIVHILFLLLTHDYCLLLLNVGKNSSKIMETILLDITTVALSKTPSDAFWILYPCFLSV